MKKRFLERKFQKLLSLFLCTMMLCGMLPTTAFAAGTDTGKAIQLGTNGINDPTKTSLAYGGGDYYTPSDYIYFGVKNLTPIKWRVLDADKANDGTTNGMFLLSEYLLENNVQFDGNSSNNVWQNSNAQSWCKDFAVNGRVFSTAAQAAMLAVSKTEDFTDNKKKLYDYDWGESTLTSEKVFFLSADELSSYVGNYDRAPGMAATDTAQNPGVWWLRSPVQSYVILAGTVREGGTVRGSEVTENYAVRPAFNLDLSSVLFTSAAVGGKSVSGMDNALTAIPDYSGNEWKLTLLDSTRQFAVTEDSASGNPGGMITLNYTGATTGTDEYISVMIAQSDEMLYYGRLAQPSSADGEIQIKIPAELAEGSYTLKVFSEQYNGGTSDNTKLTDYASDFADVALTVENAPAPVDASVSPTTASYDKYTATTGVTFTLSPESYNLTAIKNGNITLESGTDYTVSGNSYTISKDYLDAQANGDLTLTFDMDGGTDPTATITISDSTPAVPVSEQAIQLDTTAISKSVNTENAATVYFGKKTDNTPIAWRVIGYNGGGVASTSDSATLLAAGNIGTTAFGDDGSGSNVYSGSYLEGAVNTFAGNLAAGEKNAVQTRPLDDIAGTAVSNALLWPLSIAEANSMNSALRIADPEHQHWSTSWWWLRSPGVTGLSATCVDGTGNVYSKGVGPDAEYGVRPAFNLNLNSVLFTSAAVGGKDTGTGISAVTYYNDSGWKLTLKDSDRNGFAASFGNISGNGLTISYSGAVTGPNEYISAIIMDDSNNISYYGRLKNITESSDASGAVTVPLTAEQLSTGTLYIFNEQYNGDYNTDYASPLSNIDPDSGTTTHTVTYAVEGGSFADSTETTEQVYNGGTPANVPTGMTPDSTHKNTGSWYKGDTQLTGSPADETIGGNVTFTFKFDSKNQHTVTYIVVNGTWADGKNGPKTEEIEDGKSPTQIPTGMIASEGFEGGAWGTDPNGATITSNATFTYTFKAKQNPPQPTTISYAAKDGSWNTIQSVTWQKESGKSLDLTIHRSENDHLTYGLFGSLEIGGVTVASANYGAAEGSLKLSIKPEYLETLSVGDHTVKVNFQDGSATVKLTVLEASTQPTPSPKPSEKPTSPKTGDESNLALWSSIMLLSVAAMIVLLLYARKRKAEK